jgi:hypothetical protein
VAVATSHPERAASAPDESELEVGWASLVLDGHLPVGAFLDSGSVTHNFISKRVAKSLRERGVEGSPAVFRVTGVGAIAAGTVTETIECSVKRCKGGTVAASWESFLVFDTGFDILIGRATLVKWGWLREWEDVERSEWSLDDELKTALRELRGGKRTSRGRKRSAVLAVEATAGPTCGLRRLRQVSRAKKRSGSGRKMVHHQSRCNRCSFPNQEERRKRWPQSLCLPDLAFQDERQPSRCPQTSHRVRWVQEGSMWR